MMTQTQRAALTALLSQAPYSTMSDTEAFASLNAKTVAQHTRVPVGDIQRVLMETGEWWTLAEAAATIPAAQKVVDLVNSRVTEIYLMDATVQGVFDALEAAGTLSSATRSALEALGTEMVSPGMAAGIGPKVRLGWIESVRTA